MKEYKLENDEIILHEFRVKYKNKNNIKLTITNKNLILARELKLFKKHYKILKKILIKNIKSYKDKVMIKVSKNLVVIQSTTENIEFSCLNALDARKIEQEIITLKSDTSILDRATKRVNNLVKITRNILELVIIIKGLPPAIKELKEHKFDLKKLLNILFKR